MKKLTPLNGQLRRLALALTGCFGLALGAARAQAPANDDPCGAVVLTAQGGLCTAPTTSTNQNATTTVPNGYANAGAPHDVWFAFTTAATGPASFGATLTVSGNPAGLVELMAAGSCTGPLAVVAASSSGQSNTVAPRLTTGALRPNTRYYVRVAGYAPADPTGPFTICLTDGPGQPTCAPPALGTPTYGSPTTATLPYTPGINNTAPVSVTVSGPNGFLQTTASTASPIQLAGLAQGTAYTVAVTAPCAASGQTAPVATAALQTPTRYCSTGLGGGCGSAAITAVEIQGTGFDNRNQSPPCGPAYTNWPAIGSTTATLRPGVVYQIAVRLAGSTVSDYVMGWVDFNQNNAFDANEVVLPRAAANGTTTYSASFLVPLNAVPGSTGLRLRSEDANSSVLGPGGACTLLLAQGETEDYTVTIGAVAACPAPSGLAISNLTATAATFTFAPVPGAVNYTVAYDQFTGTANPIYTLLVAGSPVQLTGLLGGKLSAASVTANCGPGLVSSAVGVGFQTPSGSPANDECANAVLLVAGTNPARVGGDSNFGTVSTPVPAPTAACTVPINQDVWYRFVATLPTHDVVVLMSEQGTVLVDAFSGTCTGGFQRLGCTRHVGFSSTNSVTLTLPLVGLIPGQTYYVRIGQTLGATYAEPFFITIQNPGTGYCLTGLGGNLNCTGPNINRTAIAGTALNNIPNSLCNTDGLQAYTDFAFARIPTATLHTGTTYQLFLTLDGSPADVSLWIDYNQNYVFEPSEYTAVGTRASGATTATFTVPATATLGGTRMRLRTRAAGAGNGPGDACTNFPGSGETEDYPVVLARPLAAASPAASAQFSIYPNPARRAATLRVSAGLRPTAPAGLYNSLGQQVLAVAITGPETELALGGLAPGLYVLRLPTPAGVVVKRVVLE